MRWNWQGFAGNLGSDFDVTVRLTWLSHASWLVETDSVRIVLDPFLTDNPKANVSPDDLGDLTHVLVSHAHFDHLHDAAAILTRTSATLISNFEIVQRLQSEHQLENAVGMNLGGTQAVPGGHILMTPALHSSSFADGSYGGNPAGFVLTLEGKRIYFACDTAYFSDMQHYARGVEVAVLPIGDLFTMGIEESLAAIKRIEPKVVLPTHYGTWPPIDQDAVAWAHRVRAETSAVPVVLDVGAIHDVGSN